MVKLVGISARPWVRGSRCARVFTSSAKLCGRFSGEAPLAPPFASTATTASLNGSHRRLPPHHVGPSWVQRSSLAGAGLVAALIALALTADQLRLDAPADSSEEDDVVEAEAITANKWVVIEDVVYDVSSFVAQHPGGAELLMQHFGMDITPLFNLMHASDVLPRIRNQIRRVGRLAPGAVLEVAGVGADIEEADERRAELPPVEAVININQFEALARTVLGEDSRALNFVSSYADDGAAYQSTCSSWSFLRLLPRVFRPVEIIDTSTTFLPSSSPIPIPLFYSPTGASSHAHPDGELNVTRAAAVTGIPQIVSTMASVAFADLAAERDKLRQAGQDKAELWFQLYVMKDRKASEFRLRQALENGARAIVVTVDVAAIGNREKDVAAPPAKTRERKAGGPTETGVAAQGARLFDADLTWADLDWIKRHAPGLPVIVKGVSTVADVQLAHQHGAAGVILSNHGGRQLDSAPPPLATLVRLRQQQPNLLDDPKFEVYIDGGVKRGTDVLKALCVGAKGVGIGRAALYSSACYGHEGVIRATDILTKEITTGMRLLGAKSVKDLKPEMVELLDGLVGKQL